VNTISWIELNSSLIKFFLQSFCSRLNKTFGIILLKPKTFKGNIILRFFIRHNKKMTPDRIRGMIKIQFVNDSLQYHEKLLVGILK
jgi:hypothetical protein